MPLTEEQINDITDVQETLTFRSVSPGAEAYFKTPIKCLDHGFVRLVNYVGTDADIVRSARVSYGKGTIAVNHDKNLIRYLIRQRHTTPLESCEIQYHMKLPIFVARQLIRHRTANVNEYSARYSILDKEYYIPNAKDLAAQSLTNRQGRGKLLSPEQAAKVQSILEYDAEYLYSDYEYLLNDDGTGTVVDPERDGLARELARMCLSLNFYTQWYWKIDLHNLFHFLKLRKDKHAQYEIRVFADAMGEIAKAWCPLAYEAWNDCIFENTSFTKQQWQAIVAAYPQAPAKEFALTFGVQGREYDELVAAWEKMHATEQI